MKYYIMIDGDQRGPYTLEELPRQGVTPQTYVWCKGMDDWEQAADVADICRFYRQRLSGTLPEPLRENTQTEPSLLDGLSEEERQALEELPPMFRRIIEKHGVMPGERIPTDEELGNEPRVPLIFAFMLTLLCFPPTGFVAIYYCYRCRKEWNMSQEVQDGNERKELIERAYESQRQSRIWLGLTFFFGMILAALTVNFV